MLTLLLVLASSAVAVLIGAVMTTAVLPLVVGGVISLLALLVFSFARGSALTRYALPLLLSATVALHIQASMGMLEFHFGVFVTLALVMVYRNWRVVLACALLFAVHHVLFDRLQAWGLGMYCLSAPSFERVLLHAAFVVLQTGVEIFMIYRMNQAFAQGYELDALVQQVDQLQAMVLDVSAAQPRTEVAQRLQQMFLRVHDTVAKVKASAHEMQSAAHGIADGGHELSARSEQARQSVEETAAAISELRHSVASTAQLAQQASELVGNAAETARQGAGSVDQLMQGMHDIERGSAAIADIVGVVDSLAFQTNLLALNAAVEAARAGEQGRRLALRSSAAAKDIRSQIDQSGEAVAGSVKFGAQVQSLMQGFEAQISEAAQRMEGIAQATVHQHEGVEQIGQAIAQIEEVTTRNAELAEQSLSAAVHLQANAQELMNESAVFATKFDSSAER